MATFSRITRSQRGNPRFRGRISPGRERPCNKPCQVISSVVHQPWPDEPGSEIYSRTESDLASGSHFGAQSSFGIPD